eukprot:TRINITY_DN2256_c4_g1_i1.p1 TRINITY_DN2256_c4_g1~~TRINITY_DN2256_c4_g1_i1.p1  ORF type:complete len:194 (+),score=32.52 TRINITY_DN2256_c4_g1_i1:76-582(+)
MNKGFFTLEEEARTRAEISELRKLLLENAELRCNKMRKEWPRRTPDFRYFVNEGLQREDVAAPQAQQRFQKYYLGNKLAKKNKAAAITTPATVPRGISQTVANQLSRTCPVQEVSFYADTSTHTMPQGHPADRTALPPSSSQSTPRSPPSNPEVPPGCGLRIDLLPIG